MPQLQLLELGAARLVAAALISVWFEIDLRFASAIVLIPVTAIGHVAGLRLHDYLPDNDRLARRVLGGGLLAISALGVIRVLP